IRGSRIRAGATLMIPQGNERYARLASAYAKSHKPQDYRVRQGDSLYVIASKFKVSVSDIIAWNALDPDQYLQPGQQLTLFPSGG
ncbi:MAG: LysM peptidoglycan-binding domain-containing protein, partial [Halioglobus sp.]|nr:LysM peptidoglycan-binding domain-containing protein [Halioglobus sp.]